MVFNEKIKPFIYQTEFDSVKVFLTVGFTRPIPSRRDAIDAQQEDRYSSEDAGWTVICNDRVVLDTDRSELTGWGEAVCQDTIHSLLLFLVLLNFGVMIPLNSLLRPQKEE